MKEDKNLELLKNEILKLFSGSLSVRNIEDKENVIHSNQLKDLDVSIVENISDQKTSKIPDININVNVDQNAASPRIITDKNNQRYKIHVKKNETALVLPNLMGNRKNPKELLPKISGFTEKTPQNIFKNSKTNTPDNTNVAYMSFMTETPYNFMTNSSEIYIKEKNTEHEMRMPLLSRGHTSYNQYRPIPPRNTSGIILDNSPIPSEPLDEPAINNLTSQPVVTINDITTNHQTSPVVTNNLTSHQTSPVVTNNLTSQPVVTINDITTNHQTSPVVTNNLTSHQTSPVVTNNLTSQPVVTINDIAGSPTNIDQSKTISTKIEKDTINNNKIENIIKSSLASSNLHIVQQNSQALNNLTQESIVQFNKDQLSSINYSFTGKPSYYKVQTNNVKNSHISNFRTNFIDRSEAKGIIHKKEKILLIPAFASGGSVNKPTLAITGESGPEQSSDGKVFASPTVSSLDGGTKVSPMTPNQNSIIKSDNNAMSNTTESITKKEKIAETNKTLSEKIEEDNQKDINNIKETLKAPFNPSPEKIKIPSGHVGRNPGIGRNSLEEFRFSIGQSPPWRTTSL